MKLKRLFTLGIVSTLLMLCSSCALIDDLYHLDDAPPPPMRERPHNDRPGGPGDHGGNPNRPH